MKRIIFLSLFLFLLTFTASAEERQLQAALPGESGTVALSVTLDEAGPAAFDNYSSITPPNPQVVPEPSTLALLGLGLVGVLGWRRFRKEKKKRAFSS